MRGKAALMAAAFLALTACSRQPTDIVVTKNYLPSTPASPGECWRVLLKTPKKELKPICVSKSKWNTIKIGDHFHG